MIWVWTLAAAGAVATLWVLWACWETRTVGGARRERQAPGSRVPRGPSRETRPRLRSA